MVDTDLQRLTLLRLRPGSFQFPKRDMVDTDAGNRTLHRAGHMRFNSLSGTWLIQTICLTLL